MAVQRSRADLVYSALDSAERTWRLGDVEVQVTKLAWDEHKNRATVDARIIYQGELIADDRWHFVNPPLLTPDGTFYTVRRYETAFDGDRWLSDAERNALPDSERRALRLTGDEAQRQRMRYDPVGALAVSLVDTARIVTREWKRPRLERIGLTDEFLGDTLTVYAGTNDGYVSSSNNTWDTCRNGSGLSATTSSTTATMRASAGSPDIIRQFFAEYDTSSLGASATISGAVFTLYNLTGSFANDDVTTAEIYDYDWGGGTLTTADYRDTNPGTNITALTKLGYLAMSSWTDSAGAANSFTDNAQYGSINKTGSTRVVMMLAAAYSASAPNTVNTCQFSSADTSGTSTDPKLVVTYTVLTQVTSVTATATAAGTNPVPQVKPDAVAATATAAATNPTPTILVTSDEATATATANPPSITASTPSVDIASVPAEASVAANDPVPQLSLAPPAATVSAAANAPAVTLQVPTTPATATVVAPVSTPQISVSPPTSTVDADASAPAVTIEATSTPATATVTANAPGLSVAQPTPTATAMVDATAPGVTIAAVSAAAAATAAANAPTPDIAVGTPTATATATANVPTSLLQLVSAVAAAVVAAIAPTLFIVSPVFTYLRARYAPIAEMVARYAPIGFLTGRHAPRPELDARYAPTSDIEARYAPTDEESARHAPQYEGRARHD